MNSLVLERKREVDLSTAGYDGLQEMREGFSELAEFCSNSELTVHSLAQGCMIASAYGFGAVGSREATPAYASQTI